MALKVGDAAPDFKLPCANGDTPGEFKLSDWRGKKVVLAFYPLDFTPVCQSELTAFQADLAKFTGLNAQIVGISTDSVFSHIAFQRQLGGLQFPLAADRWPYAAAAASYGIFPAIGHTVPFIQDRAIFIIDGEGRLAWSKVYDLGKKPDNAEILAELKKLP